MNKIFSLLIDSKSLTFRLLIFVVLLFTSGCSTVSYYSQSVIGHTRLMLARDDIDHAITNATGENKRQLLLAKEIRRYAVTDLALPDNNSYLSYVDLKREYPVWSVVASKEFSLKPQQWCYPVIGCAAYRGYFAEEDAQAYADSLKLENFETHMGGATAYSTLGWFSDPLIPSMMRNGDEFLAQVIFHELAHQELYVKGNSAFNEAFATVVGEHGTLRWLKQTNSGKLVRYEMIMSVRNDFSDFIGEYKENLRGIYESDNSVSNKRAQKKTLHTLMKRKYEDMVVNQWANKRYYSTWMKTPPNNAKLAAYSTYRDLVPAFEALLKSCEGDFKRFYEVVKKQKGKGIAAVIAENCAI